MSVDGFHASEIVVAVVAVMRRLARRRRRRPVSAGGGWYGREEQTERDSGSEAGPDTSGHETSWWTQVSPQTSTTARPERISAAAHAGEVNSDPLHLVAEHEHQVNGQADRPRPMHLLDLGDVAHQPETGRAAALPDRLRQLLDVTSVTAFVAITVELEPADQDVDLRIVRWFVHTCPSIHVSTITAVAGATRRAPPVPGRIEAPPSSLATCRAWRPGWPGRIRPRRSAGFAAADDPSGDLVASVLLLAMSRSGRTAEVLSELAVTIRDRASMRLRVTPNVPVNAARPASSSGSAPS